jgi:hypothetical protein
MIAHPAMGHRRPDPKCPLRPGEPCTLCQMGATGPQDCPLVYLVMTDDELRAGVHDAAVRARSAQQPKRRPT